MEIRKFDCIIVDKDLMYPYVMPYHPCLMPCSG